MLGLGAVFTLANGPLVYEGGPTTQGVQLASDTGTKTNFTYQILWVGSPIATSYDLISASKQGHLEHLAYVCIPPTHAYGLISASKSPSNCNMNDIISKCIFSI